MIAPNRISVLSAVLVASALSFALVACDDSSSAGNDDTPISSSENDGMPSSSFETETSEIECNAENEGAYKTVKDTLTVYEDGNAMVWNKYYHCETGEWVKTECHDPQEACTVDNDGEMKSVVCTQQPDNPKAAKTEWNFVCNDKKWEKLSAEETKTARIEAQCTTPDTKIGDVCGISGYIVATGANYKDCYLYTEEGWVSKGMSFSNCDEFL